MTSPREGRRKHPKQPYHRQDLRKDLIDASLAILTEQGLPYLTLREVARRAKVSHAAPYHYFKSKQEILAAIAVEGFLALAQAMGNAIAGEQDPVLRLARSGQGYFQFALAHPAHFQVMFGTVLAERARYPELDRAAAAAFGLLVGLIKEANGASALADAPEEDMAAVAWCLVHGLSSLWIDGAFKSVGLQQDIHHLPPQVVRLCMLGLLRRPGPSG